MAANEVEQKSLAVNKDESEDFNDEEIKEDFKWHWLKIQKALNDSFIREDPRPKEHKSREDEPNLKPENGNFLNQLKAARQRKWQKDQGKQQQQKSDNQTTEVSYALVGKTLQQSQLPEPQPQQPRSELQQQEPQPQQEAQQEAQQEQKKKKKKKKKQQQQQPPAVIDQPTSQNKNSGELTLTKVHEKITTGTLTVAEINAFGARQKNTAWLKKCHEGRTVLEAAIGASRSAVCVALLEYYPAPTQAPKRGKKNRRGKKKNTKQPPLIKTDYFFLCIKKNLGAVCSAMLKNNSGLLSRKRSGHSVLQVAIDLVIDHKADSVITILLDAAGESAAELIDTAFSQCIKKDAGEVCSAMLKRNSELLWNMNEGFSTLQVAIKEQADSVITALLDHAQQKGSAAKLINIKNQQQINCVTALFSAVDVQNFPLFIELVHLGASVTNIDSMGSNAVHALTIQYDANAMKFLLKQYPELLFQGDNSLPSPCRIIVAQRRADIMTDVLARESVRNYLADNISVRLAFFKMAAIHAGQVIFKVVLQSIALDWWHERGEGLLTPLQMALFKLPEYFVENDVEIASDIPQAMVELLNRLFELSKEECRQFGWQALQLELVSFKNKTSLAEIISKRSLDLDQLPVFALCRYYENSAQVWLTLLRKCGVPFDYHDFEGNNLIHLAILNERSACLATIVEADALNECNNSGMTPLSLAFREIYVNEDITPLQNLVAAAKEAGLTLDYDQDILVHVKLPNGSEINCRMNVLNVVFLAFGLEAITADLACAILELLLIDVDPNQLMKLPGTPENAGSFTALVVALYLVLGSSVPKSDEVKQGLGDIMSVLYKHGGQFMAQYSSGGQLSESSCDNGNSELLTPEKEILAHVKDEGCREALTAMLLNYKCRQEGDSSAPVIDSGYVELSSLGLVTMATEAGDDSESGIAAEDDDDLDVAPVRDSGGFKR